MSKFGQSTEISSSGSASTDANRDTAGHEALITAFQRGEIDAESFHHREHVQLTWALLRRMPLEAAVDRLRNGLMRIAASVGKADRYHETITVFFTTMIHERMAAAALEETWAAFAAQNPDLLASPRSLLLRHYTVETLDSDEARRRYLPPDIAGVG